MKKFSKILSNSSYRIKLIVAFFIFMMLPIILVEGFSQYYSTYKIKGKLDNLVKSNLNQSEKNINNTLTSYEELCMQVASDDELVRLVKVYDQGNYTQHAMELNEIKSKLTMAGYSRKGIVNVDIRTLKNKKIITYNRINGNPVPDIWSSYDALKLKNVNDYRMTWNTIQYVDPLTNINYNLFNVYLNIIDLTNNNIIGVLAISVNETEINSDFSETNTDSSVNKPDIASLIINNDGKILSFYDKKYVGRNIYDLNSKLEPNKHNSSIEDAIVASKIFSTNLLVINKMNLKIATWKIIDVVDQKSLFFEIYLVQKITAIVVLVVIFLSTLLILLVSKRFTKSICIIVDAMKLAQKGELSVQVDVDIKDEIFIIGKNFNKMMKKISELVEEVKYQALMATEASKLQKEAEIKALEAQINPHFLYNTLDCINWIAIEKEEYEISKMLKNLAEILRYSINESNKIVNFSDEVEWMKKYIYLQENRFNYLFKTIINVEPSVMSFKINKLLIQPFIENSIIHGFEGISQGNILEVSAYLEEKNIVIIIKDNGVGMKKETIEGIMSNKETGSIGINNVLNRLKMYFGDNYEINISSINNSGTTVYLKMPEITFGGEKL